MAQIPEVILAVAILIAIWKAVETAHAVADRVRRIAARDERDRGAGAEAAPHVEIVAIARGARKRDVSDLGTRLPARGPA